MKNQPPNSSSRSGWIYNSFVFIKFDNISKMFVITKVQCDNDVNTMTTHSFHFNLFLAKIKSNMHYGYHISLLGLPILIYCQQVHNTVLHSDVLTVAYDTSSIYFYIFKNVVRIHKYIYIYNIRMTIKQIDRWDGAVHSIYSMIIYKNILRFGCVYFLVPCLKTNEFSNWRSPSCHAESYKNLYEFAIYNTGFSTFCALRKTPHYYCDRMVRMQ